MATVLYIITNIVRTVTAACSRSGLRSATSSNFDLPQLVVEIWRAFLFARWAVGVERSPSDIRAVGDTKEFRQAVKTHYFSLAFSVF